MTVREFFVCYYLKQFHKSLLECKIRILRFIYNGFHCRRTLSVGTA